MNEHAMTTSDAGEAPGSHSVAAMIDRLDNADIRWDGTYAGLAPTVVGESAQRLLASGSSAMPRLIDALADPSKFVAAHVLLTLLSGVEHQTQPWNGLALELMPDGQARFDVGQRADLGRRWRLWRQTTPPPRSLPQ
jgi:hypothetical protein